MFQSTGKRNIAMYNGKQWISDFGILGAKMYVAAISDNVKRGNRYALEFKKIKCLYLSTMQ